MNFSKQVAAEITKTLRNKFILFFGVVVVLFATCFAVYAVENMHSTFTQDFIDRNEAALEDFPIEYNGQIFDKRNLITVVMAKKLASLEEAEQKLSGDALLYAQEISFLTLDYLAQYANLFDDDELYYSGDTDHRVRYVYITALADLPELYLYNLQVPNYEAIEILMDKNDSLRFPAYFVSRYFDLENYKMMSEKARLMEYDKMKNELDVYHDYIMNNNFSAYIELRKQQVLGYIPEIQLELSELKSIDLDGEFPPMREIIEHDIAELEGRIKQITEAGLPMLDYRLEHNIQEDDGSWQNDAIELFTSSYYYLTVPKPANYSLIDGRIIPSSHMGYSFDDAYGLSYEETIAKGEHEAFIAHASLESGKPDMLVAKNGARQRFYYGFNAQYALVILAVLIGGYVMAAEYQLGTIRLLMIRPRARLTVILTKYLGGLAVIYAFQLIIILINLIANGIIYGFADYLYPNYTISGETNFFVLLLFDALSLSSMFVFVYSVAFASSVLFKNIAISTILPVFIVVGSIMLMRYIDENLTLPIINLTPVPYMSIHEIFENLDGLAVHLRDVTITKIPPTGVAVNLIYSAVFMLPAVLMFLKRDVNN